MAVTTTVVPGYTFAEGESITTAKMNLAARPSVTVTGALDGDTPATIGVNSIKGENLIFTGGDAVCDETTIGDNGDFKLEVKDLSITAAKLAGTLDLTGKNVTLPLASVTTAIGAATPATPAGDDTVVFGDTSDSGTVKQATITQLVSAGTVNSRFTSTLTALSTATRLIDEAHNFKDSSNNPVTPGHVRGVLVCQTAEHGYSVGDEVDVASVSDERTQRPAISIGANTTKVFAVVASVSYLWLPHKTTGVYGPSSSGLSLSAWKLKIYAEP